MPHLYGWILLQTVSHPAPGPGVVLIPIAGAGPSRGRSRESRPIDRPRDADPVVRSVPIKAAEGSI